MRGVTLARRAGGALLFGRENPTSVTGPFRHQSYPVPLAMLRTRLALAILAATLTPVSVTIVAAQAAPTASQTPPATFLEYQTAIPASWTVRMPSSSMRLAEYRTTTSSGDADIVVYYFGKGGGGSIDANLERWKSQFTAPAGGDVYEKVSRETVGGIPLTIAEYRGTYARAVGTGSSLDDARPNHTLIAIVAETPRGTLFFQCFGPIAAVDATRASYLAFVKGLK